MESGSIGFNNESTNNLKIIMWGSEWNQSKRLFKAAARLSGVADAIQVGELVAQGAPWQVYQHADNKEETPQEYTSVCESAIIEEP